MEERIIKKRMNLIIKRRDILRNELSEQKDNIQHAKRRIPELEKEIEFYTNWLEEFNICEKCNGKGGWQTYDCGANEHYYTECPKCNGKGIKENE